jgi:hypothetical protein
MRSLLLLAFLTGEVVSLRLSAPVIQGSSEGLAQISEKQERVERPSVYLLVDDSSFQYRWSKRDYFRHYNNGHKVLTELSIDKAKMTPGKVDLYRWQLTNDDHTKNLQWEHNDFEPTVMLDASPADVQRHLKENNIDVVLCWGSWTSRSVPPVYVETHKGGEARAISSWIGAIMAKGQNVLVADQIDNPDYPKNDVHTCSSDLVKNLRPQGEILYGLDPGAARQMKRMNDENEKILKPCNFALTYMDGAAYTPRMSSMPHNNPSMSGDDIDMGHIGFATQCWSAEPVSEENQQYTNSLMFYMKGGLERFPKCMQQNEFWHDLKALVDRHDPNIKITALAPSKYNDDTDVLGEKLAKMFEDNGVQTLTHFMEHNQLMGLLRKSVLMFGMGQTSGSPLPLDALECGIPVVLPHGQHGQYLDRVPADANLPFHAFGTCEEMLHHVDTELTKHKQKDKPVSFTISDYQPQRILDKMGVFLETMQETCKAGKDGKFARDALQKAGSARLTKDFEVYTKIH